MINETLFLFNVGDFVTLQEDYHFVKELSTNNNSLDIVKNIEIVIPKGTSFRITSLYLEKDSDLVIYKAKFCFNNENNTISKIDKQYIENFALFTDSDFYKGEDDKLGPSLKAIYIDNLGNIKIENRLDIL